MHYTSLYQSPIGEMLIAAADDGLIGIWFKGSKYFARCLDQKSIMQETSIIKETKRWLNIYFQGQEPNFMPPLRLIGTPFQRAVWNCLRKIPYGQTITYNAIAKEVAPIFGKNRMSAQAVGTAVSKNNLSLIIPCHRVVATNHSLAGYAGGLDKKIKLLKLEGAYRDVFFVPRHSTAP